MNYEIQIISFKDYLVTKGYSNYIIPMYIRKVKEFLEFKDVYGDPSINYDELRNTISEYLTNLRLSSQKEMIQSANARNLREYP